MNNNINDAFIDESPTIKKKQNKFLPLFIILIVIILAIIGYTMYVVISNSNPKTYFSNVINDLYEKSRTFTLKYDNQKYLEEPVNFTGELKVDGNVPGIEEYADYKLNYNLGLDYKNKKLVLGAGLADNEKTLVDASSYFQEEFAYLKSSTIFSDIIRFEDETIKDLFNEENQNTITGEELDYLIKSTKDVIINSIDKDELTTEKTKINIADEDISVKKITYVLDSEKQNKIINNIRNTYKNDDKILTILSNMSGVSKEELLNSLNSEYSTSDNEIVTINLYVKGSKIFKYEINNVNEYSDSTMDITVNNNIYTITMSEKDSNYTQKIVITVDSDKKYKIEGYDNDTKIMTLDVTEENDNKINISYNIDSDGYVIYGIINFEKTEESDQKAVYNFNLSLSMSEGNEEYTINISNKLTEEYNANLDNIDTNNAVDATTLSDDYISQVFENIQKQLEGTPFEDLTTSISSYLFGSVNSTYPYDYDSYDEYTNTNYDSINFDYSM